MLKGVLNNLGVLVMGNKGSRQAALLNLLSSVVVVCLVLLLGEKLWNNVLVELVHGVRPVRSIWDVLGVQILLSLLLGN